MKYRVLYTAQFHDALDAQLTYLLEEGAPKTRIAGWLAELLDLVDDLEAFPRRYPIAQPESTIQGMELHRVVFGDYLIFYQVVDSSETVVILGFRHGARRRSE